MKAASWKRIPEIVTDGIIQALMLEGYSHEKVETYLAAAGTPEFTKTHGRKPVAGLNKAVDLLYWISGKPYDARQLFQPHLSNILNKDFCRAAGFPGEDYKDVWQFLEEDMARIGITKQPSAKLRLIINEQYQAPH